LVIHAIRLLCDTEFFIYWVLPNFKLLTACEMFLTFKKQVWTDF